jgi:hypothetical protein
MCNEIYVHILNYLYTPGLRPELTGLRVSAGAGIFFLFTTASRPALRLTRPRIQWVPGTLSLGVKRPGCETDHSRPSSVEFKE